MTCCAAPSQLLALPRVGLLLLVIAGACSDERRAEAPALYADVEPWLTMACLSCHGPELAEAGYSVASHYQVLGCVPDLRPATLPAGPDAPLLQVFSRADHAALLSASEQALLAQWVSTSTPAFRGTVHPYGIVDPRSADWHGKLAAHDQFAALRDASAAHACGRCHDGAPVRPPDVTFPAPNATACTTCHTQPNAVLACDTCHGNDGAAYPPRDACYFGARGPDAHAAHLTGMRFRSPPVACESCHTLPPAELLSGDHANGKVEVRFAAFAGSSFDAASSTCAVYCHAQGGNLPAPHWNAAQKVDCQSCHQTPPAPHYQGPCSTCHSEMAATAESLVPGPLHVNGTLDLGDGSGTCGSCHGGVASGAPSDPNHALHLQTPLTQPLQCSDCHPAPAQVTAPGHLNGSVEVVFGARASARGQTPTWSASEQRCGNVACHGAALPGNAFEPRWTDATTPLAQRCETCHGAPPPPPHVPRTSCGGSLCHGDEVGLLGSALRISDTGRSAHIDGVISPP